MSLKDFFLKAKKSKPGRRFTNTYKHFKQKYKNNFFLKIFFLTLGLICIIVGLILLVIPGPGMLFIALGLACFSLLSAILARYLDKLEIFLHRLYKKIKKKH